MDELELLKKDWQRGEDQYPKLSYSDIYSMLLKKSSSMKSQPVLLMTWNASPRFHVT